MEEGKKQEPSVIDEAKWGDSFPEGFHECINLKGQRGFLSVINSVVSGIEIRNTSWVAIGPGQDENEVFQVALDLHREKLIPGPLGRKRSERIGKLGRRVSELSRAKIREAG